jgi:hypothetical protein
MAVPRPYASDDIERAEEYRWRNWPLSPEIGVKVFEGNIECSGKALSYTAHGFQRTNECAARWSVHA